MLSDGIDGIHCIYASFVIFLKDFRSLLGRIFSEAPCTYTNNSIICYYSTLSFCQSFVLIKLVKYNILYFALFSIGQHNISLRVDPPPPTRRLAQHPLVWCGCCLGIERCVSFSANQNLVPSQNVCVPSSEGITNAFLFDFFLFDFVFLYNFYTTTKPRRHQYRVQHKGDTLQANNRHGHDGFVMKRCQADRIKT